MKRKNLKILLSILTLLFYIKHPNSIPIIFLIFDDDDESKTEDPSDEKIRKTREKGQVIFSKDLSNSAVIIVGFISIYVFAKLFLKQFVSLVYNTFFNPLLFERYTPTVIVLKYIISPVIVMSFPIITAIFIFSLFINFLQTQFNISFEPLTPKFDKFDISQGIKNIIPNTQKVVELIKSIIKLAILFYLPKTEFFELMKIFLTQKSNIAITTLITIELIVKAVVKILVALIIIAAIDYKWQSYQYYKKLRMTKEEVKEEFKQREGNPHVKQAIKEKIREMLEIKEMLDSVANSDVVVTNPTHYSVALKFNPAENAAPVVVAKGVDKLALKIREIAKENNVPVLRNPPVARGLYAVCNIGEEIPQEFYKVVASILKIAYKLRQRQKRRGG